MQWFSVNAINLVSSFIVTLPFNFDHYWWKCLRIFWHSSNLLLIMNWNSDSCEHKESFRLITCDSPIQFRYGGIPIYWQCWRICCASDRTISIYMIICWNGDSASAEWHLHYSIHNMHSSIEWTGVKFLKMIYRVDLHHALWTETVKR